jgi:NADPH:quinone reductase-like Zn-dependent oxidoreductase
MKAVILRKPCSAEELCCEEMEIPRTRPGHVLVRIKARGVNRAEIFTRNGDSPSVRFPRVPGIECVGEIADASDSDYEAGQRVMSLMGGLGREFDGSYAEYALIPVSQIYPVTSSFSWRELAAIPEMYYTAWASLKAALKLSAGETLLIRGGSSSVGLAALQIAKASGATVITTTRDSKKKQVLEKSGADLVLIDNGTLSRNECGSVDKVLELIGSSTIIDSLSLLVEGGILCMTGILGGWVVENFEPMTHIPQGAYLTGFDSTQVNRAMLEEMFLFIEQNHIQPIISGAFRLDEMSQAHAFMESNEATGKIVVLSD